MPKYLKRLRGPSQAILEREQGENKPGSDCGAYMVIVCCLLLGEENASSRTYIVGNTTNRD